LDGSIIYNPCGGPCNGQPTKAISPEDTNKFKYEAIHGQAGLDLLNTEHQT